MPHFLGCRHTSLIPLVAFGKRYDHSPLPFLTATLSTMSCSSTMVAQCGQNGGNGGAPTNYECTCESESPFCKNCFRWWMSTTMQSLISLNEVLGDDHASRNLTMRQLDAMRGHSPYTSRATPSWAYIDDYIWYVLMWTHAYDWLGGPGDLHDASETLELSTRLPLVLPHMLFVLRCACWTLFSPHYIISPPPPTSRSATVGHGLCVRRHSVDVPRRRSAQKFDHDA